MSYSMRLFAVPYRVTVCVLPVLMYIAVYLSVCVLVTCLCEQLFSYCVSECVHGCFCAFAYLCLRVQYSPDVYFFIQQHSTGN